MNSEKERLDRILKLTGELNDALERADIRSSLRIVIEARALVRKQFWYELPDSVIALLMVPLVFAIEFPSQWYWAAAWGGLAGFMLYNAMSAGRFLYKAVYLNHKLARIHRALERKVQP